jgi:hypothetical protein
MRKICIIGFSQSSRDLAPTDSSWEYWGMNHLYPYVSRPWDLWFELHSAAYMEQQLTYWPEYREWLTASAIPTYMQINDPRFPCAERYPIEGVNDTVFAPRGRTPYYASTVAYAVAYALFEHLGGTNGGTGARKIDTLAVYGIDMVKDTEYEYQRPNCEYLLGLAEGLGIRVTIPDQGALLKSPWLYGYQEVPIHLFSGLEREGVDRLKQLSDVVKEKRTIVDTARADYHTHQGALQEQQYAVTRLRDIRRGAAYGERVLGREDDGSDGDAAGEEAEAAEPAEEITERASDTGFEKRMLAGPSTSALPR